MRPTGRYRDTFDRMCSLLFELAERRDPGARETANHLLAALILLAVDLPCDERTREPSAEITLAARLRSYIAMHFQEQITLESISKAVGVSPYYAAHVFKKVFGTSPIQYMIRCRMGEAQNLLITSDFSVTQIAAMVGYTGANHFTTLFTKITGLSPTQYRTWYRENLHGKCTQ